MLNPRRAGLYKPIRRKPLNKKQYYQAVADIQQAISAEVRPFRDSSKRASEKRKSECKKVFELFKKTYFPHYFYKPSGQIHRELHELCNTGQKSIIPIAIPREHGKSVICTFAEYLYKSLYLLDRYQIILSDTLDLGQEFLMWIRIEFEENTRIQQDFGELKTEGWWEKDDIVITHRDGQQCRIRAMGKGQKIRGTRFKMFRPSYIGIDDLENNINVRNKKLVHETVRWLLGAVYASMSDDGTMVMVGTTLDKISVLTLLIDHILERKDKLEKEFGIKGMRAVVYSAIKEDGTPLWPEGKSLKKLKQIREMVGEDVWLREFMNKPPDTGEFKLKWMKDFDRETIMMVPAQYVFYMGTDLSAGEKEKNDFKAHVVIAVSEAQKRYTVDAWGKRGVSYGDAYNAFFELYTLYEPARCGFETNVFQNLAKMEVERRAREMGLYPKIVPLVHTWDKVARISRWQPLVERAEIVFDKEFRDMEILILQLNALGTRENDDLADAWDMAIEVSMNPVDEFTFHRVKKRNVGINRFSRTLRREYMT